MDSNPCSDWKIDSKDPKICRNCKKLKTDHIMQKPGRNIKAFENNPPEQKNIALQTKSTFLNEKEKESLVKAKDSLIKPKDPLEKTKDSLEKTKDSSIKPNDPLEKPKDSLLKPLIKPKDSFTKSVFTKPEALNKPPIASFPSKKPEKNEENEEKKMNFPIVKNQEFKNKLEGLFKSGGNPMKMNDDSGTGFRQKKSIAPITLANGKRPSKTFEDIFDIETTIQLSKEEIKNNLTKILAKSIIGSLNLPSIPESQNGKKLREEMIKNMNEDLISRPFVAKKAKAMTKVFKTMDFE